MFDKISDKKISSMMLSKHPQHIRIFVVDLNGVGDGIVDFRAEHVCFSEVFLCRPVRLVRVDHLTIINLGRYGLGPQLLLQPRTIQHLLPPLQRPHVMFLQLCTPVTKL